MHYILFFLRRQSVNRFDHATFFIRQESGYPRGPVYKVIVFLSATRSNQELRSVDVDPLCLNLEVCFRKAYSLI